MSDLESRLDRIEQLLIESNRLRQQAIDLQNVGLERQSSWFEEQRHIVAKADKLNETALLIQNRARQAFKWLLPVIMLLMIALVILQFFR